jgi:hypothetical protein
MSIESVVIYFVSVKAKQCSQTSQEGCLHSEDQMKRTNTLWGQNAVIFTLKQAVYTVTTLCVQGLKRVELYTHSLHIL